MTWMLFACALLCALIEWFAVLKSLRRLEYIAKPAVMLFLLGWLALQAGLRGSLAWFGAGLALSLAGDVLLLLSNEKRWFLFGLGAFLLAHVAYILGLNSPPPPFSATTLMVAVMVLFSALPLVRRILQSLARRGPRRLLEGVRVYATVISLSLFSGLVTLFRTDWSSGPAYLVSAGMVLLVASDVILAWNKFVTPVRRGRLLLMITYHLGQFAFIAGVAAQFPR